jgi:hypothetical protein
MTEAAKLAYDSLSHRTLRQFKVAHVLDSAGDLWCLDLDFHAPDDAALTAHLKARTAILTEDEVLPAAGVAAWERFIAGTINRRLLVECRSMKGGVLVAIRKEA